MRPSLAIVVLLACATVPAQQQPSPNALLYVHPAAAPDTGTAAPFSLVLNLPSSPVIHCRGLPSEDFGLYLGVLSPGYVYIANFGSVDLDLGTVVPFFGSTLDGQ